MDPIAVSEIPLPGENCVDDKSGEEMPPSAVVGEDTQPQPSDIQPGNHETEPLGQPSVTTEQEGTEAGETTENAGKENEKAVVVFVVEEKQSENVKVDSDVVDKITLKFVDDMSKEVNISQVKSKVIEVVNETIDDLQMEVEQVTGTEQEEATDTSAPETSEDVSMDTTVGNDSKIDLIMEDSMETLQLSESADESETQLIPITETSEVTKTAAEGTETVTELTETSATMTETAAEVAETVAEVTETAAEVTQTVAEVTETVAEVTKTTAEVTESTAEVTESTTEVTETTAEVTESTAEVTETIEINEITEPDQAKEEAIVVSEPIIEEPATPTAQEVVETVEKATSPKPAKKITRTNSTIEAIKNDWTDSLTIEEVNEVKGEIEAECKTDMIITEPDEKQETAEKKPEEEDSLMTAVVVLEEEITGDNNITIEIIEEAPASDANTNNCSTAVLVEDTTASISTEQPADSITELHVKPEQETQTIIIVEEVENNNDNDDKVTEKVVAKPAIKVEEKPRPRGRPPKYPRPGEKVHIPCHVLGRSIDNPQEDLTSNGRTPPKPRLGVKVPYRFLTSQIVTKEEIADELLQVTNKRNPAPDPPAGGDIFFASKLTQRLASKIALNANKKLNITDASTKTTSTVVSKSESTSGIPSEELTTNTDNTIIVSTSKNTISDNSDLLAILEGDVDVDWTKEVRNAKTKDVHVQESKVLSVSSVSNKVSSSPIAPGQGLGPRGRRLDPETEREIALRQLRELPKKDGRGRPRKHHHLFDTKQLQRHSTRSNSSAVVSAAPVKREPEAPSKPAAPPALSIPNENIKEAVNKLAKKLNEPGVKDEKSKLIKIKQEKCIDVENELNLTPKRVTKTYSRKEAVLDVPAELEYIVNEPEPSSALNDTADNNKATDNEKQTADKAKLDDEEEEEEEKKKVEKNKDESKVSSPQKKKRNVLEINKPEVTLVSKRARIIKKKVIWDPAEVPKTRVLNAIRKAQLLEIKARKQRKEDTSESETDEEEQEKSITEKSKKEANKENNKEAEKKDSKETERKESKEVEKKEKKEERKEKMKMEMKTRLRKNKMLQRAALNKVQKKKLLMKRSLRSINSKYIRSSNGELKSSLALTKKKKQVMAEIAKSVNKNKTKKTELDRLLGDEGAVNMLYSVRQGKPQKAAITRKDIQTRTKVLRDVITQSSNQDDTTKALRKKESPTLPAIQLPPRKKSRDSVRSSIQSPPPSPSYFHPHRAEASRIIRRHSSSFSSDCSSPRRLSIDQGAAADNKTPEDKTNDFQSPIRILRRKGAIQERKSEEKQDKVKKDDKTDKDKLSQADKKKLNAEMSKNFDRTPKKRTRSNKGDDDEDEGKNIKMIKQEVDTEFVAVQTEYKEIQLKKMNHIYQIVMSTPANSKLKHVISLQMFHELTAVLTELSTNDSCKVVTLTSTGKIFCNGLDFSNLIQSTADKRTTAAQDMSKALKEFIQILAKFSKPLIASLHSSASNFGCTMLPYFDYILASETTTLSVDYNRLGQSPEGAPGVALCSQVGQKHAQDLLLFGKKFTAKEAKDIGLINQIEKLDKLEEALEKIATQMCEKSQQSFLATKALLRQATLQRVDAALEAEQALLLEHWTSAECQQQFKKVLEKEELW